MTAPPDSTPMVMASWFPADVALPEGGGLKRCRVYVTTTELYVFAAPGAPAFVSEVDFDRTPTPPAESYRVDLDLYTAAGLVIVRPTGGCGCGHPLKRWAPEWAARRTPWRTP